MKKIYLLTFMLGLLLTSSNSQTFNISLEWTREFNFGGNGVWDNFWGMVTDSAGNIFINGRSSSPIYSSALMKRDLNGNLVWSRTDTMNSSISAGAQIFLLNSKNKIGYFSENSTSHWIVTRNMISGNLIDIIPKNEGYSFAPRGNGDSIVAISPVSDLVVIMNEYGVVVRTFPAGENMNGNLEIRVMGNYIWVFAQYLNTNAFIAKYTAMGQQLWRVNVTNMIQPRGEVDSLGNSYFGCSKYVTGISYKWKLMKLSPAGGVLWDKEWLLNPQWDSVGNQNIFAYSISANIPKGIVVIGGGAQRDSVNNGWRHAYFMIRKIGNGDSVYAVKFANNPAKQLNEVRSIAFTPENKMLVMGVQLSGGSGINTGWLKQYIVDTLTGFQNQKGTVKSFSLYQNYPNPFNAATKISFDLHKKSSVVLTIYDINGREVFKFEHRELEPGAYEYDWNAESFSSGIYFARLNAGDYTNVIKLVLVK